MLTNLSQRKKIILIVSVILLIGVIAGFFILNNKRNIPANQESSQELPSGNSDGLNVEAEPEKKMRNPNPFVAPDDINSVNDAFDKDTKENGGEAPPKTEYEFEYELAPELMNGQPEGYNSLFNIFKPVFAAVPPATCGAPSPPATVPVYDLKAHWSTSDAVVVSNEFGLDPVPYSRPAQGGTFDYFFTSNYQSGFLKLTESSGVYTYHQVLNNIGSTISDADRDLRVKQDLARHNLIDLVPYDVQKSPETVMYRYLKSWGVYPVIDTTSIMELPSADKLCSISSAVSINYVEAYLKMDGQLERLINRTRTSTQVRSLPSHNLQSAFNDYSKSPPIDPIVIPPTSQTTGKVSFAEATIVYYDYGEFYPQFAYVPVYLLRGTLAGTTSSVYMMYPVVPLKVLQDYGIIKESSLTSAGDTGQKQATFSLASQADIAPTLPPEPPRPRVTPRVGEPSPYQPPTPTDFPEPTDTPYPTATPCLNCPTPTTRPTSTPKPTKTPAPTKTPTPTSVLAACPKQAVDYQVRCTQGGQLICTQFTVVDKASSNMSPNPADICQNGCKSVAEVFQNTAKTDPCKAVLDKRSIPIKNYQDFKKGASWPSGEMNCTVDACPC